MSAADDAGLRAVARVRRVRELDSRAGLASSNETLRARQAELEASEGSLGRAPAFDRGTLATFAAHRASLAALGSAVVAAQARVRVERAVAAESLVRWQHDRTRVDAAELLLERRADERRAAADRREAQALDEVAAQAWIRRHHGGARP